MFDKPRLEDEKIIACLRASYALSVTELEFRPLGHDSHAGVYRVRANGQAYFLKVKSDPLAMAYYRYARVVEDLGGFAEPVFFMDASDETKADSVKWFMAQFSPDGLVEVAHRLDRVLPILD